MTDEEKYKITKHPIDPAQFRLHFPSWAPGDTEELSGKIEKIILKNKEELNFLRQKAVWEFVLEKLRQEESEE